MDAAAKFGSGLIFVLVWLLNAYCVVIFISALISWVLLPPTNPVMRFLRFITEPVLSPCRQLLDRILPFSWRRIDFSPWLAILLIQLISQLLQRFFFY